MPLKNQAVVRRGQSRQLVVLVHGRGRPSSDLADVRETVEQTLPDADLLSPDYPTHRWCNFQALDISRALENAIDEATRQRSGGPYDEIVLVGLSMGALLVRKAYVMGRGDPADAAAAQSAVPKTWAGRVSRFLLLAGLNRGWSLRRRPPHMRPLKFAVLSVAAPVSKWCRIGRLVHSVHRNAPFVQTLRQQWNHLRQADTPLPLTIQLLGDRDEIVLPEDNRDLQDDPNFEFRILPNTRHKTIVDFSGEAGGLRRQIFLEALTAPAAALQSQR